MANWNKFISVILLTSLLSATQSFASCSEMLGKAKVDKAPASDIIQEIGMITSTAATPLTTIGHVAQTGSTSATTASAAVLVIPGWVISGTGVLLIAIGGIMQITRPDPVQLTDFKNLYTLLNEADAMGDSPKIRSFVNRIAKNVKNVSIDTNSVAFSDEVIDILLAGDRSERWCTTIPDTDAQYVINLEEISKKITSDINKKFKL